jgi:peptidyl-prolyl cis-trans isomerase C
MKLSTIRFSPLQAWAVAALVAAVPVVHAADAVTLVHDGQAAVTAVDVEADVQMRLPVEVRSQALASKQTRILWWLLPCRWRATRCCLTSC